MDERFEIMCVFTPTGRTYTFRNVRMVCDNETVLQFVYSAMSDGREKTATFPKATLCGWSVTPLSLRGYGVGETCKQEEDVPQKERPERRR